ncbi:MAG: hypothetical protein ACRDK2_10655 [Solirubrobacteraceae bacterium]
MSDTHDQQGVEEATPQDDFEAFEVALRTLSERVRRDDVFARELYAALCNMRWRRSDSDAEPVSMSWRYAGGVIAHLACKGECYLDYYCSGNEGVVSEQVRGALGGIGWVPEPWPDYQAGSAADEDS